ncbi:extracellular solute-binding protein [Oceanobacillus rekensis]|uniref:extracellular solute-binding protein n=1 Tax=Oceanobacillus rekensis TaxID=937927 RepID=UPI000B44DDE1|nr:extracellular solute-binding protein [Oceanobacillus rekensis]
MVTILDLAKEAGVSHGTVSNVLNRKGNVSIEKIKKVEAAAQKLGYQMNYKAKSLRSGESKNIGIVIPNYEQEEYINLYIGLERKLRQNGYHPQVYVTSEKKDIEKDIVSQLSQDTSSAVVTVSCLEQADFYYRTLEIPEDRILFVNRKPEHASHYVSFHFESAGREIAEVVKKNNYKQIGILLTDEDNLNQKVFIQAFKNEHPLGNIRIFSTRVQDMNRVAYEIAQEYDFDCFITNSKDKAKLLQKSYQYGTFKETPPIISLSLNHNGRDEGILTYHLNYYAMGLDLAQKIIDSIENKKKIQPEIIYRNDGFELGGLYNRKELRLLRILTVHSPSTEALKKILPYFQKLTNIKVQLDIGSYEEVSNVLMSEEKYKNYDLIRTDMALFPWYAERIFRPIYGINPNLDNVLDELSEKSRYYYSDVNETSYMIPFDPSVQMMFYRKDLFENQLIKRMYFKETKSQLEPPKDYEQLIQIAKFFNEEDKMTVGVEFGISLNTKNPAIIAAEFLTCYYSIGGKLKFKNQIVQLDADKGKKAIKLYHELYKLAKKEEANWWEQSVKSFTEENTAMVIGFVNHLTVVSQSKIGTSVGYKNVPGDHPLLGGGVIGLVNQSKKIDEAIQFLIWLNQRSVAEEITKLGGLSANQKINDEKDIHYNYPWLRHLDKIADTGIRESKTTNGHPVNVLSVEKNIGLVIKNNFSRLNEAQDVLKEINHVLEKSVEQWVRDTGTDTASQNISFD